MNRRRPTPLQTLMVGVALLLVGPIAIGATGRHAQPRATGELDRAATALHDALKDTDVTVEKVDERVVLRIPTAVIFEPDSAQLRADTRNFRPLADIGKVLKRRGTLAAEIRVYTDVIGGSAANQTLSASRAQALAQALTELGVAPARLMAQGMGATAAVAPNESPEGRRANRRIEILLERAVAKD